MASLLHLPTQQRLVVRATHTFGRNPASAQTLLKASDTSLIHASIRWNKDRWEILDHSRNGSFVNGIRLPANVWTVLTCGQILQFGHALESRWEIVDLDAPQTMLFPHGTGSMIPLNTLQNLLPNEQQPEFSIHIANNGLWVLENADGLHTLTDGQMLEMSGVKWEFVCQHQLQETQDMHVSKSAVLPHYLFHCSQNEEHVSLHVLHNEHYLDLGERSHHYCLLMLARHKLRDQEHLPGAQNMGWLDLNQFSRMLGLEIAHINIQIFRARKQLLQAIPEAASWPELVERRRGEVRLGACNFRIMRANQLEGEFQFIRERMQG